MKVLAHQALTTNNIKFYSKAALQSRQIEKDCNTDCSVLPSYSLAFYPNISFGRSENAEFLMKQAKKLRCAYSGMPMLLPKEIENIFKKIDKANNAETTIKILEKYEEYMHSVEYEMFQKFKDAVQNDKDTDFQEVLKSLQPKALVRLQQKQTKILNSTNKYINKLSEPVANLVRLIRDNALEKVKNNTFGRQPPLDMIKAVRAKGEDHEYVTKIYQMWYKLPNSPRDTDAFTVKYARKSHKDIAKRLIIHSQATIEHINPTSRVKKDGQEITKKEKQKNDRLTNMILVCGLYNNERHSMLLDEFNMLHPEINIPKNLQKYINLCIQETMKKNSDFYKKSWYPEGIALSILRESKGKIILNAA